MTESAFLALHVQSGAAALNITGRLHLNVNAVSDNSNQGIITSAIVHVDAHSIDGVTSQNGDTSIQTVLEQVETIQFRYGGTSNTVSDYTLDINTAAYYAATFPFFYFSIDPIYIDDIYDASIVGVDSPAAVLEDITFTPFLADIDFGFSDSNPLFSNASEQRESRIVMESDRFDSTTLPSNIDAILSGTADKANVQDSLYYDTGWSRARYKGSKTTPNDNAGIEPALSGRSFKGESFSGDATTDYICQSDNRLQQEFFHDGRTQLPKFSISTGPPVVPAGSDPGTPPQPVSICKINLQGQNEISGGNASQQNEATAAGETSIPVIFTIADTFLFPGDIITPNPFATSGIEFMRVLEVPAQNTNGVIIVERDIYRSRIPFNGVYQVYYNSNKLYRVQNYNIFSIDNAGQSRLNSVGESRIYVEGNNSIIETNKAGVLTSSSFCPVFINYVDNP
tara:strand:- start:3162 stop:4520 length:1359 start_codon:yes stop_codon:yes gene_type:complete